jgi:putative phage-type endonuclease
MNMEQRSEEWFAARGGRVTGSAVGAILGLSPYMSRDDVMRSMVREYHGADSEFSGNVATQWGTFHETGAIQDFQMETGMKVVPCGFFTHADWLGASPDGLVNDDALIEVKCPFSKRDGGEFKSISEQPHYHAQMQVQMFVTEREMTYFWQWAPHGTRLEVVKRDEGWFDDNIPVLFAFYEEYLRERENPDDYLAPKRVEINTNRAHHLMMEWDDLCEAESQAKERKAEVLKELVEIAKGKNALIDGRKLTKVESSGSISYAKAIKELAPKADLEKYRGKPSSYWKVS